MTALRRSLPLLVFSVPALAAAAQPSVPLAVEYSIPGTTRYDASIPTPEEVLGLTIGERHTRPEEVVRYMEAVAEASNRVALDFHGTTYEGRRLVHAIVTHPDNHARLGAIRSSLRRLQDAPRSVTDAELTNMPAVGYFGYSVHGNEASGADAALVFLYHLAAGQGAEIEQALGETVLLLDPMLNPDGRDRFVDWANGRRGGVATADPQDAEHNESWPGGRTNHYWFDLNRDWLPSELRESRHRMALWHTWRPQLSLDWHEMGAEASYFFQPGIPSRTNPNTPAATTALTEDIATYHAEALDRIGSLYYTEESFDDFYYGKGSTYPDINGGVGILFEQAGSRAKVRETTTHGPLRYPFTVRNQLATSASSLRALVSLRERLLRHQRDFYAEALRLGEDAPSYVIDLRKRRTRGQALAQTLRRNRIRVHRPAASFRLGNETLTADDALIVPGAQPQTRLLTAVMERTLTFTDSLFYDVSTWTFPLAYGADVTEVASLDGSTLGEALETVALDGGTLTGAAEPIAYAVRWDRYFAPRTLRRLLEAGLRVRVAQDPFEASIGTDKPVSLDRGTLVVPVHQQDLPADSVRALIAHAVEADHIEAFALPTGLTPGGNDLGSRSWPVLTEPTIGLIVGSGISSYSAGQVWHLLTERVGQVISLLDAEDLSRLDLRNYTTLIMPDGYHGALRDSARQATLTEWVRGGGTLVTLDGGARWAASAGLLDAEIRETPTDSTARPYADRSAAFGAQQIGGSIFQVALDTTHPLAYGYRETVPVFKSGAQLFEPDTTGRGTDVGLFTEEPVLSGYISEENLARLPGAAALKADRAGRGRVIGMDFNPVFRAFWRGTEGLFLNAVYFGSTF